MRDIHLKRQLFSKRSVILGGAAFFAIAASIGIVLSPPPRTYTGFAMGSELRQTWWGWQGNIDGAAQAIYTLERELNRTKVAPKLASEIYARSDGAFDPWLGALVKLWGFGGAPRVPTPDEIEKALRDKTKIDLGAYGKGAACDAALYYIRTQAGGLRAALVNLGGNIVTYGRKPLGQPFKIALRDPKGKSNESMGIFRLRGTHFISTSGTYEKFFERDGKLYHHILDPATGAPACRDPGLVSVTVVSDHGAAGDAVSTACFVLGYEKSLELLAHYGFDAIFVYEDGSVYAAGNVRDYFTLDHYFCHWA